MILHVSTFAILHEASGVAGNLFALGLFLSPMPTFRRIVTNRSTEQFSVLPYIYALLNCLFSMWYGTPLVSSNNVLVITVNSIGATFQLLYITLFIIYADKITKVKVFGLLLSVFCVFAVLVVGSLRIANLWKRHLVVGFLSGATLISMCASPLFIITLVVRTKSVEFMPFYLSLSTFLMSSSFVLYGFFNSDAFIYVPNGVGAIFGFVQLVLYFYYSRNSRGELKEPLILDSEKEGVSSDLLSSSLNSV